eukprot:scaffold1586_cov158-Amphora_coffeaeformis.AAC.10
MMGSSSSKKSKQKGKRQSETWKSMKKTPSLTTSSRLGYGRPDPSQRLEQSSSTVNREPKCFQDAAGATMLGTLVLDALWEEIKRTKHCRPNEIAEILDAYFRSDLIVQDQNGMITINSLQEYKQQMVDDIVYSCLYQDVSFTPTQDATTEPGIFDDFAWTGNRIVQDSEQQSQPTIRQEIYLIELLGAAGSFLYTGKGKSGKGSSKDSNDSPFFYSYHGKGGSNKYKQHQCHRPQIYGIVIFN